LLLGRRCKTACLFSQMPCLFLYLRSMSQVRYSEVETTYKSKHFFLFSFDFFVPFFSVCLAFVFSISVWFLVVQKRILHTYSRCVCSLLWGEYHFSEMFHEEQFEIISSKYKVRIINDSNMTRTPKEYFHFGFDVLIVALMKNTIIWCLTLRRILRVHLYFRAYRILFDGLLKVSWLAYSSNLKVRAIYSSEK
jgi:hypothetical protein